MLTYLLVTLFRPTTTYALVGYVWAGVWMDAFVIGQLWHLVEVIAAKISERRHPTKPRLVKVRMGGGTEYMFYDEWREGGWREGWCWNEDGDLILPPEAVRELITDRKPTCH